MQSHIVPTFSLIGMTRRVPKRNASESWQIKDKLTESSLYDMLTKGQGYQPASPNIVCLHHNYLVDENAPYYLTAGYVVKDHMPAPTGYHRVLIAMQKSLVYELRGPMPKTLDKQWEEIGKSDLKRSYKADWEIHCANDPERVRLYLGVK